MAQLLILLEEEVNLSWRIIELELGLECGLHWRVPGLRRWFTSAGGATVELDQIGKQGREQVLLSRVICSACWSSRECISSGVKP